MAHKDVYAAVSSVVPCAHLEWKDNSAPKLPWAVYYGDDHPIWAGDRQIAVRHEWTVELYEKARDPETEKKLGAALREAFGGYVRREAKDGTEGVLIITYDFSELEGEFDG